MSPNTDDVRNAESFLREHRGLTRRRFIRLGAAGAVTFDFLPLTASAAPASPELARTLETLEPYFTPAEKFRDVSRGKPLPHSLPNETKRQVGLTRETWKLEVISDQENPATLRHPLTQKDGTALDFAGLMQLAERHAVRFAKVMTCLNIGRPLGMGLWEGVPLRDVIWLTQPRANLRRVFYYGYHNDDPQQMFRSSLPIDRVLEDPFDLPPVILCYKLNGQWLNSERGGPVRVVVPEAYGFKSIKWLTHVVLTNLYHANDTYAEGNNDVDSWLKTFAATLSVPRQIKPGEPIPITGYAQVGLAGLSKVQVWIQSNATAPPAGDPYFAGAPWIDAQILPPPKDWGALPGGKILAGTPGFDTTTGRPLAWPMRLTKVHWAARLPGLSAGEYSLRSRTIDAKGHAQPMPHPFEKSGHSAIELVDITVKA
jgi:DMSO/TMAO reductase YedYZ molybdopterin-dependent catalytic subunit